MNRTAARYFVPTLVTLARILAVPVTVYLIIEERFAAAFWLFVLAGVSDAVDGFLAKRLNAVSRIGAFLDPLADKALLVAVYVTLGYIGEVALWLVILIVSRDIMIVGGALLYHTLTHALRIEPLIVSKANTAAQIVFVGLVLAKLGLGVANPEILQVASYIVAATTAASGGAYVWVWVRRAFAHEGRK